ncbi:Calcineurin-like phosphoesterase [Candidatus Gugararchaeum adminiculabundum]|nr:Calcineurin-like phosphoesterase [Candidatus Gugararchaeum adminiculabundum]
MNKILAFADTHADELFLDRLRQRVAKHKYDFFLVDGDLTARGPVSYALEMIEILGAEKTFVVHGNMDDKKVIDAIENVSVHARKKQLGKLGYEIAGFGGSNPTPFGTPSEYVEEGIASALEGLNITPKTILMTHAPPYGYFDEVRENLHVGSKAILKIIEEKMPILNVCAHIHETEGIEKLGHTTIVKLPHGEKYRATDIALEFPAKVKVGMVKL